MPSKLKKSDNGSNPPDYKQGGWSSTVGASAAVVGGIISSPVIFVGGSALAVAGGITFMLKK